MSSFVLSIASSKYIYIVLGNEFSPRNQRNVDEYGYEIVVCNKTRHMLLLYWTLNSFAKKYVH